MAEMCAYYAEKESKIVIETSRDKQEGSSQLWNCTRLSLISAIDKCTCTSIIAERSIAMGTPYCARYCETVGAEIIEVMETALYPLVTMIGEIL
uniref:Uncharacterized protein n=1 Tax=Pristionchus pacificus TaxID=54126 RepID=A0A2A6BEP0_PRIPA|eukprot:PDM64344.1 hypothetical protein PRIPAC_52600 [Pristionchus pacificus]